MKKIICGLCIVVMGLTASATQLNWNYNGNLATVDGVSIQMGWSVILFEDVNGNNSGSWYNSLIINNSAIVTSTADGTGDDVMSTMYTSITGFDTPFTLRTFSNSSQSIAAGKNVYTVLFDSDSIATADNFIVFDSTPFLVPAAGEPPQVQSYELSSVTGSWQAVPEPATAMLLALGGGLAWLVRLKQRLG